MKLAYLSFQEVIQEEKGFKYFYVSVCKRVNFYTHSHCWEDNQNTKPLGSNTPLRLSAPSRRGNKLMLFDKEKLLNNRTIN